jgi:hypothetical protein
MADDDLQNRRTGVAQQETSSAVGDSEAASLRQIADEFRAWVIRDLRALPSAERLAFRGDYLFVIDGEPLFLVAVTPETVSAARWNSVAAADSGRTLVADMGDSLHLDADAVKAIAEGQVRVCVMTDSLTLRRLLQGTLRAKVAYLGGKVKISGDLPCFMRLVAVLKGRGVAPKSKSAPMAE